VADVLQPEAFYMAAHREIFRTALMLHSQGKPTDLTAMGAWLADTGQLDKVGGTRRLSELVDRTLSTASIEQVARLVMDKYLRRQLIRSGKQVIRLGFDQAKPMDQVLDEAEQEIFAISQAKPSLGLTPTAEILTRTFEEIETRSLGTAVAGIPVNFYDLDAMTQGLQRSDLIIVAGRPAMGKTSIVLNIAKNVAEVHDLPVCVFSLEMSKEQLTYRLLSMEVGIESGRLRTGRLHQDEWPLLGQGISALGRLPIYIDDKPNTGVLEMRSLCRRLMSEQGRELGLVMIDYLQLMEGSGSDNRVQELSRITRGLKGMARELNVPVIALSQLSRGVEARTNKRPMLSDLRESGSIEQDADLVMMIYRDEYYNPDTPDRGITEINISKHRNGPVGTVKLLFEPQFTRFRNLAA
jgi:replicative DNA helicase